MSRSGRPRGGARRVRAERGPARRAAGVLPARSGRPSSGPGRSDRRRACGGVRTPSPGALPGRGLPGGGGRRLPGPARRGVGAGKPGPPVLVAHALGPLGRRPVPADLRHVDEAQRHLVRHRRLQHLREGPRGGGHAWPSGPTARSSGSWGRRPRSMPATTRAPPGRGAHLLAERRQGRRPLRGLLQRKLGQPRRTQERAWTGRLQPDHDGKRDERNGPRLPPWFQPRKVWEPVQHRRRPH